MGEQFRSWIPAAGAFVLGVLVLKLKDWFRTLVDKAAALLYNRLAGSALLARTALRRYTAKTYGRNARFAVSFRVDDPQAMDMASVYVPLRTASGFGAGAEQSEAAASLHESRRAVVLGVPGAGKTMLLRHTVLAWCRERYRPDGPPRLTWYGRHRPPKAELGELVDVPVLLKLHEVNLDKGDLRDHIVKHFADHDFPGAGKWIDRALAEGRLAVYFDGLDEVATAQRKGVADAIREFMRTHAKCRTVITCRIAVYRGEFNEDVDRTLRVQEFDERLIRRFLHGWPWPQHLAADTVEQLLGALRDTPQLMPLARNPLLLTMIAYLYSNVYAGTDQVLPHTRADFYKQVTDSLLGDRQRQARFSHPVKKAVLQRLALAAQDIPSDVHDRLALPEKDVLAHVRDTLAEQGRPIERAQEVLEEIVERSGLLLAVDNGERYQFAHLTLQEYLAASHLAADPSGLLERYRRDPAAWRETVRLWCGAEARDCTEVVRAVFALDPVLAFQCLADAQVVDDALADEIVNMFRDRLGRETGADRQAVIAAFGAVAGDRRPRGAAVFDMLSVFAADGRRAGRQDAACAALAATNVTRAAERLAALVRTVPGAWAALADMGDLAVPVLGRLAPHEAEAMRALWTVWTPRAAVELWDAMVRSTDQVLREEAAFRLGDMMRDPDIEEALRAVRRQHVIYAPEYPWVWKPFTADGDGEIMELVSYIASVVSRGDPPAGVRIDPRVLAALSLARLPDEERNASWATDDRTLVDEVGRGEATVGPDDIAGLLVASPLSERSLELGERFLEQVGFPLAQRRVLHLLPPRLRADAIVVLCQQGTSHTFEWERVNDPVEHPDYYFARSWHYRLILAVALAVSGCAVIRAAYAAWGGPLWGPSWSGWAVLVLGIGGWSWLIVADVLRNPWAAPPVVRVLLATIGPYAVLAWYDWWGAVAAAAIAGAVFAARTVLVQRARTLTLRATAIGTPLRRFVHEHLNRRT
ncbi:hypothetical protein AB0G73_14490 [Streptomyces sp. NPDC020719]|uniref:NACHT domain-containing protein n=1 Tax=Streptomyces sp. NPDC020719 TaxID=3154896 RepID=UPI003408F6C7